jgi:DHA1 family multidrug resistance protein-like MFS transporter
MAPDPHPAPSYRTLLVICCGVAFGCYLGNYMRLPVVPLYATSLGADTVLVGIINAAFLLTAGAFSLPLGMVSDRLGPKLLASLGLLILAASSFLLYFSRTPQEMVWIYLFSGVGLAAFGPTLMTLVANISPATHLGRSYGWYTTALYTGMTLGPGIGGFIAQGGGFLMVFLSSGILTLLVLGIFLLSLPRTRLLYAPRGASAPRPGALSLLRNRPLLGCWLATLGGCFGLGMFITFLPLHAHHQGLEVAQIGVVFSAQGLTNALSRIPFGHLSDWVKDRRQLAVAGLVGFAAALAGFAVSRSLAHFLIFSVILGISMGLAFTSVGALIPEVVPPQSLGLAMGGYNTCIYLGMMLSSALMGPVIKFTGFKEGFLFSGLLNFFVIAAFSALMKGFPAPRPGAMEP